MTLRGLIIMTNGLDYIVLVLVDTKLIVGRLSMDSLLSNNQQPKLLDLILKNGWKQQIPGMLYIELLLLFPEIRLHQLGYAICRQR